MWQHFLDHVILWAAFNLAFFQRIHLQSPIRPLCSPQFQWHDWYPVTGTQLPLTQPRASPHQTIQNWPLQYSCSTICSHIFGIGSFTRTKSSSAVGEKEEKKSASETSWAVVWGEKMVAPPSPSPVHHSARFARRFLLFLLVFPPLPPNKELGPSGLVYVCPLL